MDIRTEMLLARDRREEKTLGYDYPPQLRNWRWLRLMEVEEDVDQADMKAIGGVNYNWWDDYSYWEMKEDTIPWKGNGD